MTKTEALTPLVNLLAQTDALWEPIRGKWDNRKVNVLLERREQFGKGLPIDLGGGSAAERKAAERNLDAIEQTGLVEITRTKGKRSHWRLTDAADWRLRSICTWHGFDEMLTVMLGLRAIIDAQGDEADRAGDWHLAFKPGGDDEQLKQRIFDVEWALLPALVRGLVTSWSDCCGACGYWLEDAGREFLANPIAPDVEGANYDTHLNDDYLAALNAARSDLATAQPIHANNVAIPLGAGDWSGRPEGIPSLFSRKNRIVAPAAYLRALKKQTNAKASRQRNK